MYRTRSASKRQTRSNGTPTVHNGKSSQKKKKYQKLKQKATPVSGVKKKSPNQKRKKTNDSKSPEIGRMENNNHGEVPERKSMNSAVRKLSVPHENVKRSETKVNHGKKFSLRQKVDTSFGQTINQNMTNEHDHQQEHVVKKTEFPAMEAIVNEVGKELVQFEQGKVPSINSPSTGTHTAVTPSSSLHEARETLKRMFGENSVKKSSYLYGIDLETRKLEFEYEKRANNGNNERTIQQSSTSDEYSSDDSNNKVIGSRGLNEEEKTDADNALVDTSDEDEQSGRQLEESNSNEASSDEVANRDEDEKMKGKESSKLEESNSNLLVAKDNDEKADECSDESNLKQEAMRVSEIANKEQDDDFHSSEDNDVTSAPNEDGNGSDAKKDESSDDDYSETSKSESPNLQKKKGQRTLKTFGFTKDTKSSNKTPVERKDERNEAAHTRSVSSHLTKKVTFFPSSNETSCPTREDDENTIHSDQTSHYPSKEDLDKEVPPEYLRYRFGTSLDNDQLLELLETPPTSSTDKQNKLSPAARYRKILIALVTQIHKENPDACIISWSNETTYTKLSCNPDDFPTDIMEIASFFNGFRAKPREKGRMYFTFCLHTDTWNITTMEEALKEWATTNAYSFYKCDIQTEKSRVIGWLVYSFEFTNVEDLKRFFIKKTNFEWGFKIVGPVDYDKKALWKDRMKALQVMVPAAKSEIARGIMSNTFKQQSLIENYKTLNDCYIFIGNHCEHKHGHMKVIFDSMVTRHEFRMEHINLTCVDYIRNDIDEKLSTKQEVELTLRKMILNIPSESNEYGSKFLFQSVDFTGDYSKVWWKGQPGQPGAGYLLSYFEWDTNYALEVSKGLGAYLGRLFGKSGIYDHFTKSHWKAMDEWEWCEDTQNFSTPETRALAHNVLNDPTADIMNNFLANQAEDEPNDLPENTPNLNLSEKDSELDVQQLAVHNNNDTSEQIPGNIIQGDVTELSRRAMEIAYQMTEVMDGDNEEEVDGSSQSEESQQESTISNLEKQKAIQLFKKSEDPDLDSVQYDPAGKERDVKRVSNNDEISVSSSITDLTDNTANNRYHSTFTQDDASAASAYTIDSVQTKQFSEHLEKGMTDEEVEKALENAVKEQTRALQRKAKKFLCSRLRKAREENNNENSSPVKGKQKDDDKDEDQQPPLKKPASGSDAGNKN